jgi:hypothetical protein
MLRTTQSKLKNAVENISDGCHGLCPIPRLQSFRSTVNRTAKLDCALLRVLLPVHYGQHSAVVKSVLDDRPMSWFVMVQGHYFTVPCETNKEKNEVNNRKNKTTKTQK